MREIYDAIIIGGGASGLMTAIAAAGAGCRVLIAEKMEKCGRKVRITGKGRCNITNMTDTETFLGKVRSGAEFVRKALETLPPERLRRMLEEAGVRTVEERGRRLFPASGRAFEVADALVRMAGRAGAEIVYHARVTELERSGDVWHVITERRDGERVTLSCRNAVIATGGVSYKATGSTGDGYLLAHRLGHSIVPLRPSLVSLVTDRPVFGRIREQLRNVSLTLYADGVERGAQQGEMTIDGDIIEGPIVLRLSREAVDALTDGRRVEAVLSLKPALTSTQIAERIRRETEADASLTVEGLIRKMAPRTLVRGIMSTAKVKNSDMAAGISDTAREAIIKALTAIPLHITDYGGFDEAVVTAGGVSLDEVDSATMESLKAPGIYLTGETLDIDADTGGYNLQLAFSTGFLCGMSIAEKRRRH